MSTIVVTLTEHLFQWPDRIHGKTEKQTPGKLKYCKNGHTLGFYIQFQEFHRRHTL